jgi:hypothetical protein
VLNEFNFHNSHTKGPGWKTTTFWKFE